MEREKGSSDSDSSARRTSGGKSRSSNSSVDKESSGVIMKIRREWQRKRKSNPVSRRLSVMKVAEPLIKLVERKLLFAFSVFITNETL